MSQLQLRPTFSESWYRVAGLKAKLRASAQISRQFYRGERWYVVRDPAGNQFHRLSDAAYRFLGLLDGTRTVQEAWDLCGGQLADDAPTQPEVIHILTQLHAANLLEADITPDAAVLLRRHKQMRKRQWQGRLMNILFPRIPLWDPDQFLKRWMPVMRVFLSGFGIILWLALVVTALVLVAPQWDRLRAAAVNSIDPNNWLWLWAVFVGIKLVHELGHAFICRRFGGEVHELGVMFLVLVPAPYVDASTAWAFPSRWQRMLVGGGGMVFELFVAAIAAVVWTYTSSNELVNQLAYNTMLIASVSTVLFNANPLLRYDGYYMLSDFLEIPNLRHKSTEYSLGIIKRHVFRVKSQVPLPPPMQRVWLLLYAISSTIYRVFIGIMIIIVVGMTVPILGTLMAIGGVITWLVVPVVKLTKYLAIEPELHRKRGRAVTFVAAVATAVVVLIGVVPSGLHIDATGILEPGAKEVVRNGQGGIVTRILVRDGQLVRAGEPLLVLEDKPLEALIEETLARQEEIRLALQQATVSAQWQRQSLLETQKTVDKQLADLLEQQRALTVTAGIDGRVIAPDLHEKQGMYLPRGTELATVAQTEKVLVRANIDQKDYELWWWSLDRREAEVRLASQVGTTFHGESLKVLNAASNTVVHPSVGHAGGGPVELDPRDEKGQRARTSQFEMEVVLPNPGGHLLPGQKAYVRCHLDKTPLIWQWKRRFLQLLQAESESKWL